MDSDKLLAHARVRFDHAAARRTLKEKYQSKLTFGWAGGMFRATPEMIVFLDLCGDDDVIIQDLYENPVRINAQELKNHMQQRWQEQMTAWLLEHDQLNQRR